MLGYPHIYSCEMFWLDKDTKAAKCTLTKLQCWQLCPGTIGTSKSSSCGNHGSSILLFIFFPLLILIFPLPYQIGFFFFFYLHSRKGDYISVLCPLKSTPINTYRCYVCALCWFYASATKKYCKRLQEKWTVVKNPHIPAQSILSECHLSHIMHFVTKGDILSVCGNLHLLLIQRVKNLSYMWASIHVIHYSLHRTKSRLPRLY